MNEEGDFLKFVQLESQTMTLIYHTLLHKTVQWTCASFRYVCSSHLQARLLLRVLLTLCDNAEHNIQQERDTGGAEVIAT